MNRWIKALAGGVVATALVIAPMGAYAEEPSPAEEVAPVAEEQALVAAEATAEDAPAEATAEDAPAEATAEDAPAEASTLTAIVETGDEEEPTPVDEKWVFVCKYVGTPGVDERLQTSVNNPVNVSVNSIKDYQGIGSYFGDDQGRSYVLADDPDRGGGQTGPDASECPLGDVVEGTPTWTYVPPSCDAAGSLSFGNDPARYQWSGVYHEDGTVTWTADAAPGVVFPVDAVTSFTVPTSLAQLDIDDPLCRVGYPVPAQFNADPEPPTCVTAGSFATGFLGEPDEEGWYEFENIWVWIDRSVEGEVYIYVESKLGFSLVGLDETKWYVYDDGTWAERTIVLGDQLSGPELCPLVELPAPLAPTFTDECGVEDDWYTVPGDTEAYFYEVTEEGDSVFIEAFLVNEEDTFPEGTVTEWEFTFTDEACPTPTSTPPATLPATGGPDMMPWGIGAAAMLLAGAALLTVRRLARR